MSLPGTLLRKALLSDIGSTISVTSATAKFEDGFEWVPVRFENCVSGGVWREGYRNGGDLQKLQGGFDRVVIVS